MVQSLERMLQCTAWATTRFGVGINQINSSIPAQHVADVMPRQASLERE